MAENALAIIDTAGWDLVALAATLDDKRRSIFLRVLSQTANTLKAAQAAGFRSTAAINRAMKDDPIFAEAVKEAVAAGADALESEVIRRGVEGVDKDVYFKGEVVGQERVYSDGLLQTAVKAAKPEKYADRKEVKHDHTGTVGVAVIPMTAPNIADWERQSIEAHDRQKLLKEPVIEGQFTEAKPAPALAMRRS